MALLPSTERNTGSLVEDKNPMGTSVKFPSPTILSAYDTRVL